MVVADDFGCRNMVVTDDFWCRNMVVPDDFWCSNMVVSDDFRCRNMVVTDDSEGSTMVVTYDFCGSNLVVVVTCRNMFVSTQYQFNSSTVALHCATYTNIPVSTEAKKIKSRHNTLPPWRFPPQPPHDRDLSKYRCNTRSDFIALTATSPATIHPLGSVRFALFLEK
jgi:hypothetical protein